MPTPLSFKKRIAKAIVFFASSLVILSLIRVVFFATYKTPEITFAEFLPAAWMGVRVDAKWLATLAVPAWLLLCLSAWRYVFWRLAVWMAGLATAIAVTVAVVNFGFYDFYRTPISPIIFGLFQDDTTAIVKTLQSDWPDISVSDQFDHIDCVPSGYCSVCFPSTGRGFSSGHDENNSGDFGWNCFDGRNDSR